MYEGKTVGVVGGGNTALEEALFLSKFASKVYMIRRYDYFKGEQATLEEIENNSKIEILYNWNLIDVYGSNFIEKALIKNVKTNEEKELNLDGIFGFIGSEPKTELFKEYISLNPKGYIKTNENMETNIKGVYAAGDVREKQFRQITTAVADGTIAALTAEKYIIEKRKKKTILILYYKRRNRGVYMFKNLYTEDNIYKNFIKGQWVISKTNKFIEITSPIDGSLIGKIPSMDKEEVDLAVKTARESQPKWNNVPINERASILLKAADILDERAEEIADIMIKEIAKDKKSSISEIHRTADYIRFSTDTAKNMVGETISGDSFPGTSKGKISIVNRVPLGVVLAISPFNYPINLSASKIAPALMAGNSVVLKPATQGSISALYLVKVFEKAGLPSGVLNTVTGKGSEIGDYIVSHPMIDFINFTGSTEIGKRISHISVMKPMLMELGGKDAAIVLEDADLDLAAKNIVSGAYSYSGQRCTAVKRILVLDKIADTLIKKVKEKVESLIVGNPLKGQVDIVPLINDKAADYAEALIKEAKEKKSYIISRREKERQFNLPYII